MIRQLSHQRSRGILGFGVILLNIYIGRGVRVGGQESVQMKIPGMKSPRHQLVFEKVRAF